MHACAGALQGSKHVQHTRQFVGHSGHALHTRGMENTTWQRVVSVRLCWHLLAATKESNSGRSGQVEACWQPPLYVPSDTKRRGIEHKVVPLTAVCASSTIEHNRPQSSILEHNRPSSTRWCHRRLCAHAPCRSAQLRQSGAFPAPPKQAGQPSPTELRVNAVCCE